MNGFSADLSSAIGNSNIGHANHLAGPAQVDTVASEFEGLFMSLLLKEMRSSLGEGGLFGGDSSDTYGGMFDLFLGQQLAQTKPLGIGQVLMQQYRAHANPIPSNTGEGSRAPSTEKTSFTA